MSDRSRVLVRGAGDVGSAVAVVLHRAGYAVALHDGSTTTTPRRGMAFADAIFDGWATLDGRTAVRVKTPAELRHALNIGDAVPVAMRPAGRCPTLARNATRPGACTLARSRRLPSTRRRAPKVVDEATCVGCKVCTIACPFGTINYVADTGKVQKCDLCGGKPACAEACPTQAITYIDADWTGLDRMRQWAARLDNQPSGHAD